MGGGSSSRINESEMILEMLQKEYDNYYEMVIESNISDDEKSILEAKYEVIQEAVGVAIFAAIIAVIGAIITILTMGIKMMSKGGSSTSSSNSSSSNPNSNNNAYSNKNQSGSSQLEKEVFDLFGKYQSELQKARNKARSNVKEHMYTYSTDELIKPVLNKLKSKFISEFSNNKAIVDRKVLASSTFLSTNALEQFTDDCNVLIVQCDIISKEMDYTNSKFHAEDSFNNKTNNLDYGLNVSIEEILNGSAKPLDINNISNRIFLFLNNKDNINLNDPLKINVPKVIYNSSQDSTRSIDELFSSEVLIKSFICRDRDFVKKHIKPLEEYIDGLKEYEDNLKYWKKKFENNSPNSYYNEEQKKMHNAVIRYVNSLCSDIFKIFSEVKEGAKETIEICRDSIKINNYIENLYNNLEPKAAEYIVSKKYVPKLNRLLKMAGKDKEYEIPYTDIFE